MGPARHTRRARDRVDPRHRRVLRRPRHQSLQTDRGHQGVFTALSVRAFELVLVPGRFAICRLASQAPIPPELAAAPFVSITRTADELSIVCAEEHVPATARCEAGWR